MVISRMRGTADVSKRNRAFRLAKRLWTQMNTDHLGLISAGVAFYGLLSLFPAITALIAIGGLLVQPDEIVEQLHQFSDIVPEQVMSIIVGQASDISGSGGGGLGLTAVFGIGIAIWSASRGMASLMEGMNVAYGEKETRGFVKLKAMTLALTLLIVSGVILGMLATMAVPVVMSFLQIGAFGTIFGFLLVCGVLILFTLAGLSLVYRFGPNHSDGRTFNWMTPGAPAACILWIAASGGFAFYVSNFGSYNGSFGALSGVIVLLLWLWISAYVVLLGAELNAETERMTSEI